MRSLIAAADLAAGKTPPEGIALQIIEKSWEYGIGHIPTRHLEECFIRAMRAKVDTFPFSTAEMNAQWLEMQQDLLRVGSPDEGLMLPAGRPGDMSLSQWKEKHGLPPDWSLGDPYPETSDLYKKPVPLTYDERRLFTCYKCKDAGWTRIPYNPMTAKVILVRCECQATDPA